MAMTFRYGSRLRHLKAPDCFVAMCGVLCSNSMVTDRALANCRPCLDATTLVIDDSTSARSVMYGLRRHVRVRGIECSLTLEDVLAIRVGKPCHYCGAELPPLMVGLDRIDNGRGYHADNVVPCCYPCNTAKGKLLSAQEFQAAMAIRIARTGRGRAW
jgi:hypothetical protein